MILINNLWENRNNTIFTPFRMKGEYKGGRLLTKN